jgi:hypothetical protein
VIERTKMKHGILRKIQHRSLLTRRESQGEFYPARPSLAARCGRRAL